jgi:hypothetical protein
MMRATSAAEDCSGVIPRHEFLTAAELLTAEFLAAEFLTAAPLAFDSIEPVAELAISPALKIKNMLTTAIARQRLKAMKLMPKSKMPPIKINACRPAPLVHPASLIV